MLVMLVMLVRLVRLADIPQELVLALVLVLGLAWEEDFHWV